MSSLGIARLFHTELWHSGRLRALSAMGGLSIAILVLKFGQDLVLAYALGAGRLVDSYGLSFALVTVATTVTIGPAIVAILPSYVFVLTNRGRFAANSLVGNLIPAAAAISIGLTIILFIIAPNVISLMALGKTTPAQIALSTNLLRVFLLLIPIRTASQIASAILNAEYVFAIPVATGAIPALTAIGGLYLFVAQMGIYALAFSLIFGEVLQAMVLLLLATRLIGPVPISWRQRSTELRAIAMQYIPALAGTSIAVFNPLIDRTIASGLPLGSISHLLFAERIVSGGTQIATVALSAVLLPHFSRLVAVQNFASLRRHMLLYSSAIIGACSVPVAVAELFARPIVQLLLQRGSFHVLDTIAVTAVLRMLVLQLPFNVAGTMISKIIAALRVTQLLTAGALLSALLNVSLDLLLVRYWQLPGIAASTSIVFLSTFLYLFMASWVVIGHRERSISGQGRIRTK